MEIVALSKILFAFYPAVDFEFHKHAKYRICIGFLKLVYRHKNSGNNAADMCSNASFSALLDGCCVKKAKALEPSFPAQSAVSRARKKGPIEKRKCIDAPCKHVEIGIILG